MEPSKTPDPQPPQDFATRFSQPQAQPQPPQAPPPQALPPQAPVDAPPYSFGGLFEASLLAPFQPWACFADAARRPAPGLAAAAALVASYAAAFFALNVVHAAALFPSVVSSQPPERVAAVGAAALILALLGSLAAAAAVHAASLAAGGEGGFSRSYQTVAMLGLLLPLQAAAFWYPPAAVLPTLVFALGAAAALEKLHRAPALGARLAMGALAGLVVGSGWLVKQGVERAVAPYLGAQQVMQQALQQVEQLQQPGLQQPGLVAIPPAPDGQGAPQGQSSLDMLGAPAGATFDGEPARGGRQAPKAAADMINGVAPLLQQAGQQQDLTPQQRQQLNQLGAALGQLQKQMSGAQQMSPQQQAQMLRLLQQQMGQFNGQRAAPQPGAKPADPSRPAQ